MIGRRAVLAAGSAFIASPALAIDPGVASGKYDRDGVSFTFSHSMALALDNAEGARDQANILRLLLSDRELPLSAITGLIFTPVGAMARAGAVRGLLIEFSPADRNSLQATVLAPPEGGFSLANISLSDSEGLWSRLDVSATRAAGELKPGVSEGMAFSFSAPVFTDAVQQDLKGPQAAASAPMKAVIARAEAIGRGDFEAAYAMSTQSSAAALKALGPDLLNSSRKFAPELIRQLKAARRVVIRRETANIFVGPDQWSSATLVDGVWKAAD